jgi:aconitate hydratase 2/2-methylisocitrate dehydratase
MTDVGVIDASSKQIYQYLNFDKIDDYKEVAATVAA